MVDIIDAAMRAAIREKAEAALRFDPEQSAFVATTYVPMAQPMMLPSAVVIALLDEFAQVERERDAFRDMKPGRKSQRRQIMRLRHGDNAKAIEALCKAANEHRDRANAAEAALAAAIDALPEPERSDVVCGSLADHIRYVGEQLAAARQDRETAIGLAAAAEERAEYHRACEGQAWAEAPRALETMREMSEVLQPFADFVSGTSAFWDDTRRIVTLNYDLNTLTVGLFRAAARVLDAYRMSSASRNEASPDIDRARRLLAEQRGGVDG